MTDATMALARLALCLLAPVALAGNVLINAGGPYIPSIGWRKDTGLYASAGAEGFSTNAPTRATGSWAPVYESHCWTPVGDLEMRIPVPRGKYDVALMFAETWAGARAGSRRFIVMVNGRRVMKAGPMAVLDVFQKAGGLNRPVFLNLGKTRSSGGYITVTLVRVKGGNNPMISGIAIMGRNADGKVGNEGIGHNEENPGPAPPGNPAPAPAPPAPAPPAPPAAPAPQAVTFTESFVETTSGTKASLILPAVAIYGPDFRLYVGTSNSTVHALSLNKDFQVTKTCTANVQDQFPRSVLGLAFNPKSNALKLHFSTSTLSWMANNNFVDFASGWTNGKVETITMAGPDGCFNNDRAPLITGLPVSNRDHAINALEFLPSGELLVSVGGFTNGGISVPSDLLGGVPSNPLSGSIITCPPSRVTMMYSNLDDPVNSMVIGGACTTYATGFRNSYGMTYHTNEELYATDNGPNMAFGDFATDCVGGSSPGQTLQDELHKVAKGQCHGHPNINRNQCVFNDPACSSPMISTLMPSMNGVAEYRSYAFGGAARGNLFLSQFSAGGDGRTSRVQLNGAGNLAGGGFTDIFFAKSGLTVVEGPRGELVMPRFQQGELLVLQPSFNAPTTTALLNVMPRRGPATGGATVLITGHNFGSTPSATFGGSACTSVNSVDADTFTCVTPTGTANSQIEVVVTGSSGVSFSAGKDYWYY